MTLFADLRHVIYALSDALDLVGVDDVAHGKRVGIMAAECGRVAGMSETDTTFLLDLGMLHDIGVSSTRAHCNLVEKFDWNGSQVHCEVGHALLKGFGPLEAIAEPVRYHHTRWDALPTCDVAPDTLRAANLIYLVDRVDALATVTRDLHRDGVDRHRIVRIDIFTAVDGLIEALFEHLFVIRFGRVVRVYCVFGLGDLVERV